MEEIWARRQGSLRSFTPFFDGTLKEGGPKFNSISKRLGRWDARRESELGVVEGGEHRGLTLQLFIDYLSQNNGF